MLHSGKRMLKSRLCFRNWKRKNGNAVKTGSGTCRLDECFRLKTGIPQKNLDLKKDLWYTTLANGSIGLFFMPIFTLADGGGRHVTEKYEHKSEVEVVRTRITLECTECKHRNYNMTKDKKTHPERMETKKYCRFCKSHTVHKETK